MATLSDNSYGKYAVRLTKVTRHGDVHELKEMGVSITLRGDFDRCYTHGDNSKIIATDTMKNTVYALAKQHPIDSIEEFAKFLCAHFLDRNLHVKCAQVIVRQVPWTRIDVDGRPHDHSFVGGNRERRSCLVTHTRHTTTVSGKIERLSVLKTTRSGFVGYLKDEFTTLKETTDRIFATDVEAGWKYSSSDADWNACYESIRRALLATFATHDSLAVQQTLYAMGEAALDACDQINEVWLTMPNQHRLLVNLEPFGMDNPNEIFVPTNEPFGYIRGTIKRD